MEEEIPQCFDFTTAAGDGMVTATPPMKPLRILAIAALLFCSAPRFEAASSGEVKAAVSAGATDEDDLTRIKRTNTIAPDRPAAQQTIVAASGKDCKVLFLGDSNTHFWEGAEAKPIWDHYYKDRLAINFGIGGDTTNDIRARLRDTQWGDCRPPVTVVLAGTNDRGCTPAKRANKIKLLLEEVASHFPQTKILLVSIPPCGLEEHEPLTTSYLATDEILKTYADGKHVFYIDLAGSMTWEEGLGFSGLGGDRLHLNKLGRLRWAESMEPVIARTLNETPREPLPHPQLPEYTGDPNAPKIMVAGDGLAFNGDFRANLQYQLRDHGCKYHFVGPYADPGTPADAQPFHFGDWGAKLEVLQKTIPPVTKKYAPDILVLFAGFGEVNYGKNQTDTIATRAGKIIDDTCARSPSTRIIFCLVTPHSAAEKNATIITANQQLADMVKSRAAEGRPVLYVDCYSGIDNAMLSQGYLPSKAGSTRAAALVSPTIEAILKESLKSGSLPAPVNLSAAPGESAIQLEWQAVSKAASYNVKRSMKEGGPYAIIGTDVTEHRFTDSNYRRDTDYYYVVSAVDASGQGRDSAEVKVARLQ